MLYWDGDVICYRRGRETIRFPKEASDMLIDMLRRMCDISGNCQAMLDWVLENGEVDPTSRSMLVDVQGALKEIEEVLP